MANTKISQLTSATTPLAGTEVVPLVQSGTTKKATVSNLTANKVTTVTSTDNAVVRFDGTAGQVQNSGVTVDDSNNITASNPAGVQTLILDGNGGTNGADIYFYADIAGSGNKFRSAVKGINISNTGSGIYFSTTLSGNTAPTNQLLLDYYGKLAVLNTNGGINFTANTGAAGMTSQLLNWYEEGTWTPNQGGGLTVVGAFSSAGTYTRIGRQVFIRGSVSGATSVAVASAGDISTNLPYSSAADTAGAAINAANNASSVIRVSSATLTAATAIAVTATITFSAVYSV